MILMRLTQTKNRFSGHLKIGNNIQIGGRSREIKQLDN